MKAATKKLSRAIVRRNLDEPTRAQLFSTLYQALDRAQLCGEPLGALEGSAAAHRTPHCHVRGASMSADDNELLDRAPRCIKALIEVIELGQLWRVDVIEGARELLAELQKRTDS